MSTPDISHFIVHGARSSVYVRAVLMALEAKGVSHDLVPLDVFSPADNNPAYRKLHPFGRIPTIQHGDFTLYETAAINRHIDDVFDGPSLQPETAQARARSPIVT